MLTILIAIFIGLVVIGAVCDAVFRQRATTSKALRYVLAAIPSPYNIMRLYAKIGDNLDDFTRAHAISGMAYLGIMFIVAAFAWWADQQVLYGIEMMSSRDPSYSWWQSAGIATIIQALLIFNGGMAIKLHINGMREDPDHSVQFKIHTFLAVVALCSTGYLSFQTDSIAEAKGLMGKEVAQNDLRAERDSFESRLLSEIAMLKTVYAIDSQKIEDRYKERAENAAAAFLADSLRKENHYKRGVNSRHYVDARIATFRKRMINAQGEALSEKRNDFDSLEIAVGKQIKQLQRQKVEKVTDWIAKSDSLEIKVEGDIEYNAGATRFKNLLLNVIALFLNLGLQFFNRGANKEEQRKRLERSDDLQESDDGISNFDASTITHGAPNMQSDDPLDQESPGKLNGKVEQKKAKGGSIEANQGVNGKIMPGGEVVVLYRGTNGDDWWNWSKCRASLKNRVNKFNKAKSDGSRKTQLAWIRLIEAKMDYIEKHQSNGKKFPVRKTFNPNNPKRELFNK